MRRRLAFSGEIGCQNDFLHFPQRGCDGLAMFVFGHYPVKQLLQADVIRAYSIERAEFAHQHKIHAPKGQRTFQRRLIGRGFHHAQLAAIALRTGAGHADFLLRQGVAQGAVPDAAHGMLKRLSHLQSARPVMLHQMKSHAGR